MTHPRDKSKKRKFGPTFPGNLFWLEEEKLWKPMSDEATRQMLISAGTPRKDWKYFGLKDTEV